MEARPQLFCGNAEMAFCLSGGGVCGRVLREFDWSTTSLGNPNIWPASLQTAVRIILNSAFPMALHWGPEFITFYNDAFAPLVDRSHPGSLGRSARIWRADAGSPLGRIFAEVLRGGTYYAEDSIYHPGQGKSSRDTYFTHCHSPVRGDNGDIEGILVVAFETTDKVLAERALRATNERHGVLLEMTRKLRVLKNPTEIMYAAAETIGRHLRVSRAGFAEKSDDDIVRHTIGWTDGAQALIKCEMPGSMLGAGLVAEADRGNTIVVNDVTSDPRTAGSAFPDLGVRSCVGVPVVRNGRWHAGFYVHCSTPRAWSPHEVACTEEVAALAWDAVERAYAQSKLLESETRFRTALDIAQLGTFDWDLRSDGVIYSERTREIFGFTGSEGNLASDYFQRMLPEDRERMERLMADVSTPGQHVQAEYRIQLPGGTLRYITAIGEGFCNPDGKCTRVVGVVSDTSERKRAEQALRESAEVFNATFEQAGVGITHIGRDGFFRLVNRKFCDMVGYSREELYRKRFVDLAHPEDRTVGVKEFNQAFAREISNFAVEKRYLRKDGNIIWARITGTPIVDELTGNVKYNVAVIEDITERKQNEERQLFMLRLDACLRDLTEPAAIQREVCRLLGRRLQANYVYYAEFDDDEDHLVIRGDYRDGARQFADTWRLASFGEPITSALRAGRTVVVDDIRTDPMTAGVADAVFDSIDSRSGVAVPLLRQGKLRSMFTVLCNKPHFWPAAAVALIEEASARAREAVERGRAEQELRITSERLSLAIAGSGDGVWDWYIDDGHLELSGRMKEILGYPDDDLPNNQAKWMSRVHPEDLRRLGQAAKDCLAGKTESLVCEYRIRCWDGSYKWLLSRGIVVARDARNRPVRMTGMITDISDRKEADERIWRHANFDALTGLPNRRLFRDRLHREVMRAERANSQLALLFIDLDRFKQVNDLLGHDAGDQLLMEAARRIAGCVRESDTVARLGGDEFTVILSKPGQAEHVEHLAEKLLTTLSRPFRLNKEAAYVSGSIGVAIYPDDGTTAEELIRKADQAMYAAKHAGKNQFSYFTHSMDEKAHLRLRLANELRNALAAGQLEVHYQPVIDFRTGMIVKAEALLRWRHPVMGTVEPSKFIPLAEESGMITEIGNWVFREAAGCSQRWGETFAIPFQIAVNKSPVQFLSHADENWLEYLNRMNLSGTSISIEITEGMLLHAANNVAETLLRYRDAGIQVAIDDFGTGYSSMAYLKKFDIDYLKIDQSFVKDITTDATNRTIAESIIVMAHKLGLKVIAEGIETADQMNVLRAAGCDYGQGYLFSPAVPAVDFERLLDNSAWQGGRGKRDEQRQRFH